jgi:hypothetical protein
MLFPEMPDPIVDEGCVLVADPNKRFAFTNMMFGGLQPQDASGAGQFPFTAEITISAKDTGCSYQVTVRHLDEASANIHGNTGFFRRLGYRRRPNDCLGWQPI